MADKEHSTGANLAPPTPPLPGGGSWRLVAGQWVPADAVEAAPETETPQPTEE